MCLSKDMMAEAMYISAVPNLMLQKLMEKYSYRMRSLNIGELAKVRITHSYEFDLSGEVIA